MPSSEHSRTVKFGGLQQHRVSAKLKECLVFEDGMFSNPGLERRN